MINNHFFFLKILTMYIIKIINSFRYYFIQKRLAKCIKMVYLPKYFLYFSDIFIDTTGFAFTYPIFRYLAQCPVICYVHYPTITAAMMRRVKHRIVSYNNSSLIARNPLFTWLKLIYYKIFGWVSDTKLT